MPSVVGELLTEESTAFEVRRAQEILRRWRLYNGRHPKPLALEAKDGIVIDDNITPNFCGRFVDQGVSFLVGGEVVFTLEPDEEDENETEIEVSPEEKQLNDIWAANRKDTLLRKLTLNGGIAGHCFVRLMPREGMPPRLINLDPANVAVLWDQDDIEKVLAYKVQWNVVVGGQIRVRRQLVELQQNDTWTVRDEIGEERTIAAMFGPDKIVFVWRPIDASAPQEVWPYPFPPIMDWQNLPVPNEYYGGPDLSDDVIELNMAASRIISNLGRVIRFHGHPKTVGKGIREGELKVGLDDLIYLADPSQSLENLEMRSDLSAGLKVYKEVYDALHEVARRPKIMTGNLDNVGQLSALAIHILHGPVVEVTGTKRGTYGEGLNELNKRILTVADPNCAADYELACTTYANAPDTTVHWPDLIPRDILEEANAGLLLNQLGVSKATQLERMGYDPRTEAARSADEADAALVAGQTNFDQGVNIAPDGSGGTGNA